MPLGDGDLEIHVTRHNDANVDRNAFVCAHGLNHFLLQRAQELGLRRKRHVSDLVQEQGPAVGREEPPGARAHRTGERTLDVPEELRLHEVLRNGAAVQLHHRLIAPGTPGVDRLGDDLLAGPGLALDDDVRVGNRDLPGETNDGLHRR